MLINHINFGVARKVSVSISTILNKVVFTFNSVLVTKFVFYYNPQITNARIFFAFLGGGSKSYKSNITLNSGLSMLVGISEAIRLLFFKLFNSFRRVNSFFSLSVFIIMRLFKNVSALRLLPYRSYRPYQWVRYYSTSSLYPQGQEGTRNYNNTFFQ